MTTLPWADSAVRNAHLLAELTRQKVYVWSVPQPHLPEFTVTLSPYRPEWECVYVVIR